MSEKQVQPENVVNDRPVQQKKIARRIILRPLEKVAPTGKPINDNSYPPYPGP